jgi:hypothetical protein
MRHPLRTLLALVAVCGGSAAVIGSQQPPTSGAGGKYQVVKACSLVPIAEVKKLAPWPPQLDQFAKAEEEPLGTYGSSCNYPTVFIQVMSFRQSTIDAARKAGALEPAAGVGDEAYLRNNKDRWAELIARVGPHLLTLQLSIDTNKTYDSTKPALIELAKVFASKLR